MSKEINILGYLPQVMQDIQEYQSINDAVSLELEAVYENVDAILNNQFILTADEDGIERWEKTLSLKPKLTSTMEDRRFSVYSRLTSKLPYTMQRLDEELETLCGTDNYDIELLEYDFVLVVRIALIAQEQLVEVLKLLYRQVPANMEIDFSILYNSHVIWSNYTHATMSGYTHKQLREEILN